MSTEMITVYVDGKPRRMLVSIANRIKYFPDRCGSFVTGILRTICGTCLTPRQ
jgi:hypothetical protein